MRVMLSGLTSSMLLCGAVASVQAAAEYNVINLGTLPSYPYGYAEAINGSGQVTGYSSQVSGNGVAAAFFYSGGTLSAIPTLGGGRSLALAINASGQVAGYSTLASGAQYLHGFIYTPGSGTVDIGSLSNGTANSFAYGINDSGTAVGYSSLTAYGGLEAVSYSASTGLVQLGYMPGGTRSEAFAINNSGVIVGDGDYPGSPNPYEYVHAFMYTPGSGFTDIGAFGGGISTARGINNLNEVVGSSELANGADDAFAYTAAGGMVDLGTLGGGLYGPYSGANSVNDHGVIVGSSTISTVSNNTDAFISNGSGMTDLNTLVSASAGWTLSAAYSINNAGDIVGNGIFNGKASAFELVPITYLLGDANQDGRVDLSDLNIVLNNLGTVNSAWTSGNFDGAATIDLTDLNDVLNNLGVSATPGAVAAPEPASLGILGISCLALLSCRYRRASNEQLHG